MTEHSDLFSKLGVTPMAVFVGVLMMGLASLATAWNQIDSWLDRRKDKPAPAEVAQQARELYATKPELQKLETDFSTLADHNRQEHDNLFRKLGGVERGLRAEMKADVATLTTQLHELGLSVAGLAAETKTQNQNFVMLMARVDRSVDRELKQAESHKS